MLFNTVTEIDDWSALPQLQVTRRATTRRGRGRGRGGRGGRSGRSGGRGRGRSNAGRSGVTRSVATSIAGHRSGGRVRLSSLDDFAQAFGTTPVVPTLPALPRRSSRLETENDDDQ